MTAGAGPSDRRRRWFWIMLPLAGLIAAAGYRWIETMPVGTGESRASPDGRYVASVMDVSDRAFFSGVHRRWFRFQVTGPDFNQEMDGPPLPGPYFGSRSSTSVVRWEPDSSAVRFVFPTAEVRIETRKAPQD